MNDKRTNSGAEVAHFVLTNAFRSSTSAASLPPTTQMLCECAAGGVMGAWAALGCLPATARAAAP